MGTCIYYFSGTGNSLRAAFDLAALLRADAVPISLYRDAETVETDAQTIGFVFPVYYGDLPVMMAEFVGKIKDLPGKTVFAVCTYGGAAMDSFRTLRSLLQARGGRLTLAIGVPMPQNSFRKPYENKDRRYARWKKYAPRIAKWVKNGAAGIHYSSAPLEWLMLPLTRFVIKPMCKKAFARQSGLPANAPFEAMIRRLDAGFTATDACNGCGICVKVCPAGNIEIASRKPLWQHRCENCLACYNWCPQHAIAGGVSQKGFFYRHPQAGVKDFIREG